MLAAQHARQHDPEVSLRDEAGAAELLRRIRARVAAEVKRLRRELAPVADETGPPAAAQWPHLAAGNGKAAQSAGSSSAAAARARLTRMEAFERALDGIVPGDLRGEWAGPGSIVVVEDAASGEREECVLMPGNAGPLGPGYVSLTSPLGEAVAGRGAGATVAVALPDAVRLVRIVAVRTLREVMGVDASDLETAPGSRRRPDVLEPVTGPA